VLLHLLVLQSGVLLRKGMQGRMRAATRQDDEAGI
jgi:hypothetical protein